MPTKRYKPEQIMTLLRQVEVVIANGKLTPQACREARTLFGRDHEVAAAILLPALLGGSRAEGPLLSVGDGPDSGSVHAQR